MKTPEKIMKELDEQVSDYEDYADFLDKLGPLEKSYVMISNYLRNIGFQIKGWEIYQQDYHWGNIINLTGLKNEGESYENVKWIGVNATIQVSPGTDGEHFVNISTTQRPAFPKGYEEFALPASWSLKS